MPRALRSAPLTSVQNVGIEIARVYRRTKKGEIPTSDGYRLVMILSALKQCLESSALEQRLAALEAQADIGTVEHFRPRVVS
jgi:hypothetical protein